MSRLLTSLVAALALVACGGGDGDATLAGYRREPAPDVGQFALPDMADAGAEQPFRAEPGGLLIVYFGYTNCPDFCPTTLADLKFALNRLDDELADRIDVAMVTVDPERDLPILDEYVTGFFDDGMALGTDDAARLAEVAAPFGVTYDVSQTASGETEVAHSTSLYAVDDQGELVLTWQFGVEIDDLADDLGILLQETEA